MKKFIFYMILAIIAYLAYIAISLSLMPPVSDLADKKFSTTIQVRDWQGDYHPFVVGPKNRYWAPSSRIPAEMKWAVILAEDANFYKHEGFDVKAIKNAIKYDLEKKSLKRGASTITQQAAKNLFLSREKTITRKLKEIYLAYRMEQELTKGRIIELYLNVVELGPMVYGIGHGAQYYFGKPASALSPRECAFLAAMLPGPRVAYNPYKNLGKVLKRSDMILRLLRQKGVLGEAEYQAALAQSPNVGRMQQKVDELISTPPVFASLSSAGKDLGEKAPETETEKKEEPGAVPAQQPGDTPPTNPHESPIEKK
ncbi:MAG TPA: biosynthetic peptidoglycan transglycosylase [Dongiaceae bacterium]|nr:biosynthetic peptidoglycan transglycosylase [Dongiaceae bacterium]